MKLTHSDTEHNHFIDHFYEIEVHFKKNKKTNQIMVDSDDMAHCFGYNNIDELLLNTDVAQEIFFGGLKNGMVILM